MMSILQFDGLTSSSPMLDDDDRFAHLKPLPLVATGGSHFTLPSVSTALGQGGDVAGGAPASAALSLAQLLSPPADGAAPAEPLTPAQVANQVFVAPMCFRRAAWLFG